MGNGEGRTRVDRMEKNKNRTDLLAAGRKKVILFALNSDFAWFRNVQHLKCLLKFDD